MNKWHVHKDGNCYKFHSKEGVVGSHGIHAINIYVFDIPIGRRTETHAYTYNLETYKKILDEGKQHASEKSAGLPAAKQYTYYFDSTYDSFERMNDRVRERLLSDSSTRGSFLECSLSHYDPFDENDTHGCASNIEESLSVLAKADEKVAEIIDYMNEEIAPRTGCSPR